MKVRFILPGEDNEPPRYDQTVSLPYVPGAGTDVGIPIPEGEPFSGGETALICTVVSQPRLYLNGEEPLAEVWLTDNLEVGSRQMYRPHTCRYGYEQMMANVARPGR